MKFKNYLLEEIQSIENPFLIITLCKILRLVLQVFSKQYWHDIENRKYEHLGIAMIQDEMIDTEKKIVAKLAGRHRNIELGLTRS